MPPPITKKKKNPVPIVPPKGKGITPPQPPNTVVLTVEVVEVLSGDPVKTATVEVIGQFKKPVGQNGKATTHPMPPGTYGIVVGAPKHGPVPAKKGDAFTPDVNVFMGNVVLAAGTRTIKVEMCDGTGALLVRVKRQENNALIPLKKPEIEVVGQRKAEADDTGERFFTKIPAGKFTVRGRKPGYGPLRTDASAPFAYGDAFKDITVPAGHPEQVELFMENQTGFRVTKLEATIVDTVGLLPAPATTLISSPPAGSQRLTASTSDDLSLTANKPVVLVRGSNLVTLTVTTDPANKRPDWQIKPNENASAPPALTVSADRQTATLAGDKTGSFAVIVADGESRVVWNVVYVHAKVDFKSGVITVRSNTYADSGSTATNTGVRSGQFIKGQAAMEAKINITLVGGGADGKLGTDQINLHDFQNGLADSATGEYIGPPAPGGGANITGKMTETPPNNPVIDSTGPNPGQPMPPNAPLIADSPGNAPPTGYIPGGMIVPLGNQKFQWGTLDSPAFGVPRKHATKNASLRSITGANPFRTAIAVTSKHAVNNFIVVAFFQWTARYDGDVKYPAGTAAAPANVPAGTVGTWSPKSNTGTTQDVGWTPISDTTGGTDAVKFGFRVTGPRFNSAAGQTLVPS